MDKDQLLREKREEIIKLKKRMIAINNDNEAHCEMLLNLAKVLDRGQTINRTSLVRAIMAHLDQHPHVERLF